MRKMALSVLAAGVILIGSFAQAEAAPANSDSSKPAAVKVTTTAGRTRLGEFAPEFARYNDDVLFGEVWSRNDILSLRERSLITVASLMSSGILDSSLTPANPCPDGRCNFPVPSAWGPGPDIPAHSWSRK